MQPASLGGVLDRARGFLGDLQLRHLRREDRIVRRYVLATTGACYRNGVGIFLSSYFPARFDHQRAVGLDVDNPALRQDHLTQRLSYDYEVQHLLSLHS